MKQLAVTILSVLFISCLAFGQAKKSAGQGTVEEIKALENAWDDASQKYDIAWFERNLADSYHGTDENGVVSDKAAAISNVKNKAVKIESISSENRKVQVYGNTAVATGIALFKGTYKGKDVSSKYAFTDTLIKIGGRWQVVASHLSKLPAK